MRQVDIVENAMLIPVRKLRFGLTRVGLYDGRGQRIDGWPLLTSADTCYPVTGARMPVEPEQFLDGTFIYGGFLSPRLGHFLTETVPNLVAIADACRASSEHPILFHCWPEFGPDQMTSRSFIPWFLDLLGLADHPRIVVMRPLRVRRLILQDSPFLAKFIYKSWLASALDRFLPPPPADGPQRVYLSRTHWAKNLRLMDEARIEAIYRDRGYLPVHMQELSLSDQLGVVRGCRHLAGPQGSALHWSLYSHRIRTVTSLGWKSGLQAGICNLRNQTYFNPRGMIANPLGGGRTRWFPDRAIHRVIDLAEASNPKPHEFPSGATPKRLL